jgi:hypothetical protein
VCQSLTTLEEFKGSNSNIGHIYWCSYTCTSNFELFFNISKTDTVLKRFQLHPLAILYKKTYPCLCVVSPSHRSGLNVEMNGMRMTLLAFRCQSQEQPRNLHAACAIILTLFFEWETPTGVGDWALAFLWMFKVRARERERTVLVGGIRFLVRSTVLRITRTELEGSRKRQL